jgi:hypothetical protein
MLFEQFISMPCYIFYSKNWISHHAAIRTDTILNETWKIQVNEACKQAYAIWAWFVAEDSGEERPRSPATQVPSSYSPWTSFSLTAFLPCWRKPFCRVRDRYWQPLPTGLGVICQNYYGIVVPGVKPWGPTPRGPQLDSKWDYTSLELFR